MTTMTTAETATTMTRTLKYGRGYRGRLGTKCWIARITGTDPHYGLSRTFLAPVSVEREHFNRSRTIIECSYELQPDGLYELSAEGERWFVGCYLSRDGEVSTGKISDARVKAWAKALDAGETDREARLASKGL
jgi:hypothetical protein